MPFDVYYKHDIAQDVLGKMIVAVETAFASGVVNYDHLAGQMTAYKGMALSFGIDWAGLKHQVMIGLGSGAKELVESL